MTKTAFNRDGVLTPDDRAASAKKRLLLLAEVEVERLSLPEYRFLRDQREAARFTIYAPSERQLAYLRDLVERYAQ
jgi:hypothetical protein